MGSIADYTLTRVTELMGLWHANPCTELQMLAAWYDAQL
jgi:hypothetical protein